MFAAHGAAQGEGRGEDFLDGLFGFFHLTGDLAVDHDVDMDVAVAGVAEVDDGNRVLRRDRLDLADHVGNTAARHADVLVEFVGIDLSQARRDAAAHLPDLLALGGVFGHPRLHHSQGTHDLQDALGLTLDEVLLAVDLDDEDRLGLLGKVEVGRLAHALDGRRIHELQGRGDDLAADDGRDPLGRSVDGIEQDEHRLFRFGFRKQFDHDFRDDPQRPLAAAQQFGEVVADDPLHRLSPRADDVPLGGDDLEAEDVVLGDAVLDAARPAGAFGDVAPEGAELEGGGIGGVEKAYLLHRDLKLLCDDAGLDFGHQVLGVDAQDAVHARRHQDDSPRDGEAPSGEAASGPPGEDGDLLGVGHLQDAGDLPRIGGKDDDVGEKLLLGGVVGVAQQVGAVGGDVFGADDVSQGLDDKGIEHENLKGV